MVKLSDLKTELSDEIGTILAKEFEITARLTKVVPHSNDAVITFPNLDTSKQACKIINTCVLYIDIRRSTELSIEHKPHTVAKLYSAFVRAMTKCARHYGGHVRGIIGDRVMVIFDCDNAFTNAVDCAILMNSTSQYVLNKHFTRNEIRCGIGIDAGRMLVTKTGFQRRGVEQHNYKNLVWLGRPANVASKLTDIAHKAAEVANIDIACVGYDYPLSEKLQWRNEYSWNFLKNLDDSKARVLTHKNPSYYTHFMMKQEITLKDKTPPILMTAPVYSAFKAANPERNCVKKNLWKVIDVKVAGYDGKIYGGDVIFTAFT